MATDVQQPAAQWTIRPDHEMPDDDPMALTLAEGQERIADGDTGVAIRSADEIRMVTDAQPEPTTMVSRVISTATVERPPIVSPIWFRRSVQAAFLSATWGDLQYKARFHAWKAPGYVLAWAWWVARGLPIAFGLWVAWCRDPLGKETMDDPEQRQHRDKNRQSHNAEIKQRVLASAAWAGGSLLLYGAACIWWSLWGRYVVAAVLVAAVVGLMRVGRPEGAKLVATAIVTRGGWSRLTYDRIRSAFVKAGVIKDPAAIEFPREIQAAGPGEVAYVQLPDDGLDAQEVAAKRRKLALAFRVPIDQIYLEPATGLGSNVGMLQILMAHAPTSELQRHVDWPKWPLLLPDAQTSFFRPIPIAHDIMFRPVFIELDETNTAIAGRSGSGKTGWLQKIVAAALMDPTVEVRAAEYKGVGDLIDAAPLMPTYICGLEDADFAAGVQLLAWGLRECDLRGPRLKAAKLAGKAPDGKVTPELAATPGSGLHPILIPFDEIHELFEHEVYGKDAKRLAINLHRRGRALGIHFVFATQIPDKSSVPPILLRNSALRVCCAVKDHIATNMILGTGAYAKGWDPTNLRPKKDAGWAYFAAIEDPTLVKAYDPTRPELQKLYARADKLRGGRVVGAPIDDAEVAPPRDILVDVEEVFRELGWDRAQWVELAPHLAERWPATYAGLTADGLSADLRKAAGKPPHHSVKPKDGTGKSLKGTLLSDVREALDRRQVEHQERLAILSAAEAEPDTEPDAETDEDWSVEPDEDDAEDQDEPAAERPDHDEAAGLILMAAEMVIGTQHATVAMLQRKLRLGYEACMDVMTALEQLDVVGSETGAGKSRAVLVEPEDADDALVRVAADLRLGAMDVPDLVPSATGGTSRGTTDIWGR